MKSPDTLLVKQINLALAWIRSQTPLPASEPLPSAPPEVVPPPPETPIENPPEIRDPDLPGVNAPIISKPDFSSSIHHQSQGIIHV